MSKSDLDYLGRHKPDSPVGVPDYPHYAIIVFETHANYSGREGDVVDTHVLPVYYAYKERDEWLAQVTKFVEAQSNRLTAPYQAEFVAFSCGKPVQIRREIVIEEG